MHEDIDDFEPDLNSYYRMDSEDKKLIHELESWERKFYLYGNISNDQYMEGLKHFYPILSLRQMNELKEYDIEKLKLKSIEAKKKNLEIFKKQKSKEEFNDKLGCVAIILFVISLIIGTIASLTEK